MIDPLISNPKQDNDLQLARTASIPANEKYHAKEWNAIIDKINEIINDLSLGQVTDSVTKTTATNIVRLVEGALIETNLTIRNLPAATTEQKIILLNSLGEAALADISDYSGSYIEILDQFNDSSGYVDLDLITEEGTYVIKYPRDQPGLNGLPYYDDDGPVNVQIDVFITDNYTMQRAIYYTQTNGRPILAYRVKFGSDPYFNWDHSYKEDYNGVAKNITSNIATSYNIYPRDTAQHYDLTMTADTDINFLEMIEAYETKVITITLKGDYAFQFPIWLKPLETNDEYDTIEGSAEIVINIKNGGTVPSGYYSLQMVDYAL